MSFVDFLQERWNTIVQVALLLVVAITKFTIPPTFNNDLIEGQVDFVGFSKFLVAGVILLLLLPAHFFSKMKHAWFWWSLAVISLTISLIVYFKYNNYVNEHSVFDNDAVSRTVTGDIVLPEAQKAINLFQQKHPSASLSKQSIIQGLGGAENVWPKSEIMQHSKNIMIYYLITVICFSIFITCGIQALYIVSKKKSS